MFDIKSPYIFYFIKFFPKRLSDGDDVRVAEDDDDDA